MTDSRARDGSGGRAPDSRGGPRAHPPRGGGRFPATPRPPILPVAAGFLLPLILLFSLFLLLRGADEPGGAFIAGVVAATGFGLQTLARGAARTRAALGLPPRVLMTTGLAMVVVVAGAPLVAGQALLQMTWARIGTPGGGVVEVGTPLLFEVGIYLIVVGAMVTIITLVFAG